MLKQLILITAIFHNHPDTAPQAIYLEIRQDVPFLYRSIHKYDYAKVAIKLELCGKQMYFHNAIKLRWERKLYGMIMSILKTL